MQKVQIRSKWIIIIIISIIIIIILIIIISISLTKQWNFYEIRELASGGFSCLQNCVKTYMILFAF